MSEQLCKCGHAKVDHVIDMDKEFDECERCSECAEYRPADDPDAERVGGNCEHKNARYNEIGLLDCLDCGGEEIDYQPEDSPADPQPASDLVEEAMVFIQEWGQSTGYCIAAEDRPDTFYAKFAADFASQQNAALSRKVRELEAERKHFLEHVSVISFDGYFEGEIAHVLDAWKAERECYSKNKYGGDEVEQRKAEFGSFDEAWDWILSHGDRCSKGEGKPYASQQNADLITP